MLSKQLQDQIEQEAIDGQQILPATEYSLGINKGYEIGYEAAGEKYGQLYETALARAERAERALEEIKNLATISNLSPGSVRGAQVLRICKAALTPKTGEDE